MADYLTFWNISLAVATILMTYLLFKILGRSERTVAGVGKGLATFIAFIAVAVPFVLLLANLGALQGIGINQPFTAGGAQIQPQAGAPSTSTTTTTVTTTEGQAVPIDTFSVLAKEALSNSYTTANGTLRFYDSGTDPKSPTASNIDTITLTSGAGSSTAKKIKTETPYRVILDGGGSMYDDDYGIITFASKDYNKNTGQYLYDLGSLIRIATLELVNASSTDINGVNSYVIGTDEVGGDITNATGLTYDESVGDGQFYLQPTINFNGANQQTKEPVACFEWDTSNPPEGNEISALTQQLISGTDLAIASSLIDFWSKQECVSLGSVRDGGVSSKIKLTITVDEANLDANADIWYFYMDDLGGIRAKDARLNTGAVYERIKFDSQA